MQEENTLQMMPKFETLLDGNYTKRQWLTFYRNLWMRNAMARTIDVESDRRYKEKDPEMVVITRLPNGMPGEMPVKERLEDRKINLQDAIDLVATIDVLLALTDDEIEARWSADMLAVAPDMIQKDEEEPAPSEEAPVTEEAPQTEEKVEAENTTPAEEAPAEDKE